MIVRLLVLSVMAVVLAGPVRGMLVGARWLERSPRAAIVLWQSIGSALLVALLGMCIEASRLAHFVPPSRRSVTDFTHGPLVQPSAGLNPAQLFALTVVLIAATLLFGALFARLVGTARARARQRQLIELVGQRSPELDGTVIVSYPDAMAFSLPGLRPRVVLSSGALDCLSEDELSAVLVHERAHLRAHHDLALLPFRCAAALIPSSPTIRRVHNEVGALIEMAADDAALRKIAPESLARALCRLGRTSAPDQSNSSSTIGRRIERALSPQPPSRGVALASLSAAITIVALPIATMFAPITR